MQQRNATRASANTFPLDSGIPQEYFAVSLIRPFTTVSTLPTKLGNAGSVKHNMTKFSSPA